MIALRDLRWRPQGSDRELISGLDLEIPAGQRVLLTGPSGSGKSTVLRALAGLLDPEAGELEGQMPKAQRPGERALLLQDPVHALVGADVGRDIAFGPENAALPREEIWERVETAARAAAVDVPLSRDPLRSSGGQQQRIALAGSLALEPEALLLDEPCSMLDAPTAQQVRQAVLEVAEGRTLVVADHDVDAWREHVDRVIVLAPGARIAADGTPAELLDAPGPAPQDGPPPGELVVSAAQLTAVTGPSGAGKTTLLRQLAERTPGAQLVPQRPAQSFVAASVAEECPDAALLERAGLTHLARQNPHRLSGGEQRRLAIVSALSRAPRVLLVDEPTVGLDPERARAVMQLLEEAECAVVAATHDPRLLERADHRHEVEPQPVPEPARPRAAIDALNPLTLALIGICAAIGSFAVSTWQVGLLALLPTALLAPLAMRTLRGTLLRLAPVALAAASLAWTTALLGTAAPLSGAAWLLGLKEAARIAVFVAPGVLTLGSVAPTALGDALGGRLHWPARPVAAGVAALVRAGHLGLQWQMIVLLRRLRGLGTARSPRLLAGATLALLIDALRGAEQQALALDARGFDTAHHRTWAEPSPLRGADLLGVIVAAMLLAWPLACRTLLG